MSEVTALLPIADHVAERLLRQMHAHADDAITGACRTCNRTRCMPWKDAYAELAAAGRITTRPIGARPGGVA